MHAIPSRSAASPAVIHSSFALEPVGNDETAFSAPQPASPPPSAYDDPALALIAPHVDRSWYRATYRDVGRTNLDPAKHFHEFGWRERRNPNSWFDTRWYLAANPDVSEAGINPLQHYLAFGRGEGRLPRRAGGALREAVDFALPPSARPVGYDAPDQAERLDAARLQQALAEACIAACGLVVAMSHDRYIDVTGGVQILITDEQALFRGDCFAYLHLSPVIARLALDPGGDEPEWLQLVLDGSFLGLATGEAVAAALAALPEHRAPSRLFVVHSLFGHRTQTVAAIAAALRPAHRFFWLHDYASLCEGFVLLRDDAAFCAAPPASSMACRICVYGAQRPTHQQALRELFDRVPFHVLAPSRAALAIWRGGTDLPHLSARVHENALLEQDTATAADFALPVRVAFVGYPVSHKGWPLFRELVQRAHELGAYRFHHFSTAETLQPMEGLACVPARVDRDDRFAMTEALAAHQIDLVLVLSPWPETFSFVTHEAMAAGADVVALATSGNVADAVARHDRGVVLRDGAALLQFFLEFQAVHYVRRRAAAGIRTGRLRALGTTATVDLDRQGGPEPALLATDDPDLRVVAGDAVILPERDGDIWRFALPVRAGVVRLVSRSVVPARTVAGAGDHRRMGVAVGLMALDGVAVPPDDARRLSGWHGPEMQDGAWQGWEWTSGDAALDAGEARLLEVGLEKRASYLRLPLARAAKPQ
jgi:hypothetical protein